MIFDWFAQKDQQERLGRIILNNKDLMRSLNLDFKGNTEYDPNAPLNYLEIAKVGILVFADHVYDEYIAPGGTHYKAWIWTLWNTHFSGQTLVDVVANMMSSLTRAGDFFSGMIQDIKAGATKFMNGVKAGLSYIADVLLPGLTHIYIFSKSNHRFESLTCG